MFQYELNKEDMCLCGSGKHYKYCCFEYIELINSNRERERTISDYTEIFNIKNAQLTQYLIKVMRHTLPILSHRSNELSLKLFKIDLSVVQGYIETIIKIVIEGNLNFDITEKIMNITNLIDHQLWEERMLYLLLLFSDLMNDKDIIIKKIKNINIYEIIDINLMQICYQLMYEELGIGQKQFLLNRIIKLESDLVIKLKYKFDLCMVFWANNDQNSALQISKEVISELVNIDISDNFNYLKIAGDIYHFHAIISNEKDYYIKSIECLKKIVDLDILSDSGKASIFADIGYTYYKFGNNKKAIEYLEDSKKYQYLVIADIYLSDIFIEDKKYSIAKKILYSLKLDNLQEDNKVDYLFTLGKYLILNIDTIKGNEILTILKNNQLKNSDSYFENEIKDLIIALSDIYINHNKSEYVRLKWLDKLNKYCILQPNFFGLGLNFNNIIDDFNKNN